MYMYLTYDTHMAYLKFSIQPVRVGFAHVNLQSDPLSNSQVIFRNESSGEIIRKKGK